MSTPKTLSDEDWMSRALKLARVAGSQGDVPIGALIVRDGAVIAEASNEVEIRQDATAHAEILAIQRAQKVVHYNRLLGCVLYVTKEPCPMCAGAIVLARLQRVVFGLGDTKQGGCGGAYNIMKLPGINHVSEITAGVLEAECHQLLKDFFGAARNRAKKPRQIIEG